MKNNILLDKSLLFAARIVKLHKYLNKEKKESIISKQILRSGTSIGANANEAVYGVSKAEFISKLQISLKETAETEYWLRLLLLTEYITEQVFRKQIMFLLLREKNNTVAVLIIIEPGAQIAKPVRQSARSAPPAPTNIA